LLSRGYWGHLATGNGQELRACPTCKEQHADWEARLLAGAGPSAFPQAGASSGAA
jgi:hypothetical protein